MLLSFDLGTGGVKICICEDSGVLIDKEFVAYNTTFPEARFHVQNPNDWWAAIIKGSRSLAERNKEAWKNIFAIAGSGQSLTVIPLDNEGTVLFDDIPIWSDTRSVEQAKRFFLSIDIDEWYKNTGNGFSPECYSIFKLMWYKENYPDRFDRVTMVLGSKDYINYRLTGRYATDHSYASGFGAYSLKERNYIGDYLSIAGISRWILPDPVRSTEYIGNLCNEAAAELALTQCVRVYCGGVDNSCMTLGALNIGEGRHYMSLGSSAWIAISSTTFLVDTTIRPFVFSHVLPDMYTSATSIFSAGSSLRWFRDTMAEVTVITGAHSDIDPYVLIDEAAKASPVGSRNVIFNPTLAGSPAASEYPHMKGAFLHLDLSISFPDIARAVLEGIAFELFDMHQKLQKLTKLSGNLVIVGGGSKSDFWMQMFADVFGIPVSRLNIDQDAAALGAAAIAAVGSGLWNNFDRLSTVIREIKIFMPDLYIHQMYQSYFETYLDARRKLGGV